MTAYSFFMATLTQHCQYCEFVAGLFVSPNGQTGEKTNVKTSFNFTVLVRITSGAQITHLM